VAFFKALIPGCLLTFIISLVVGSNGSRGAWLSIDYVTIESVSFYWSWPLFLIATGLAWALFWMME